MIRRSRSIVFFSGVLCLWCAVLAEGGSPSDKLALYGVAETQQGTIALLRIDTATAEATKVSEIPLEGCDCRVFNLAFHIYVLNHLFLGGPAPLAPFPECGAEGGEDRLDCALYPSCK